MKPAFWHQKWQQNQIRFHQHEANPLLVTYFEALNLMPGSRVLLPLCGKTLDIAWLVSQGYQVIGVELSELAVQQLFVEADITPKITNIDTIKHYSAPNIDVFVGDIFNLTRALLPPVDAIYDRAALVALPYEMRFSYTSHLIELTQAAPQLLIIYEYDQQQHEGPPFSVEESELRHHYQKHYNLSLLLSANMHKTLKGTAASQKVWLLQSHI